MKRIFATVSFSILTVFTALPGPLAAAVCNSEGNRAGLPCLSTQDQDVDIKTFLQGIRTYLLGFSAALAVLFIIWGGFLYVTSAGNEERQKTAKTTLTYSIGGLILILLAQVILSFITGDFLSTVFTGSAPY